MKLRSCRTWQSSTRVSPPGIARKGLGHHPDFKRPATLFREVSKPVWASRKDIFPKFVLLKNLAVVAIFKSPRYEGEEFTVNLLSVDAQFLALWASSHCTRCCMRGDECKKDGHMGCGWVENESCVCSSLSQTSTCVCSQWNTSCANQFDHT